jgi:polysaccharide pyruvyl transferase WcaK-like protein
MKTISLHGSYFQNNFGDILLMAIITNWLKEAGYSVNLPVSFESMRKLIGADTIGYSNYLQSEALVFGGGGYFGEPNSRLTYWTYRNYLRHILPYSNWIKKSRKPYMIMGVGVGPITSVFLRKKVISLFENAVIASVRDNESLDYLKKYGLKRQDVNVMPDIALTLNLQNQFISGLSNSLEGGKFKIAYHLSYPNGDKITDFFLDYFKERLERERDLELTLIVDSTSKNKLLDSVSEKVGSWDRVKIERYSTPIQIMTLLNSMDQVITHKLHVGIVSLALNKPVLSFPLHQKTLRLYKQLEIEGQCLPLSQFESKKFQAFLDSKIRNSSTGKIREVAENAMNNKINLMSFLNKI